MHAAIYWVSVFTRHPKIPLGPCKGRDADSLDNSFPALDGDTTNSFAGLHLAPAALPQSFKVARSSAEMVSSGN